MTYQEYIEENRGRDLPDGCRLMTEEEYAEFQSKEEADKAAATKITVYIPYMEQAADTDSKDEAEKIVRAMTKVHDEICQKLYKAGDQDALGAHIEAFDTAKKTILAPYKKRQRRFTPEEYKKFVAACERAEEDED